MANLANVNVQKLLAELQREPNGAFSSDLAARIGISPGHAKTLLRVLRNAGLAGVDGTGVGTRWATIDRLPRLIAVREEKVKAAQEANARYWRRIAERKAEIAEADRQTEQWVTAPVIHSRISANNAPRIQRSKPYSVFNLAAA